MFHSNYISNTAITLISCDLLFGFLLNLEIINICGKRCKKWIDKKKSNKLNDFHLLLYTYADDYKNKIIYPRYCIPTIYDNLIKPKIKNFCFFLLLWFKRKIVWKKRHKWDKQMKNLHFKAFVLFFYLFSLFENLIRLINNFISPSSSFFSFYHLITNSSISTECIFNRSFFF